MRHFVSAAERHARAGTGGRGSCRAAPLAKRPLRESVALRPGTFRNRNHFLIALSWIRRRAASVKGVLHAKGKGSGLDERMGGCVDR
jgi:hypothetical protein